MNADKLEANGKRPDKVDTKVRGQTWYGEESGLGFDPAAIPVFSIEVPGHIKKLEIKKYSYLPCICYGYNSHKCKEKSRKLFKNRLVWFQQGGLVGNQCSKTFFKLLRSSVPYYTDLWVGGPYFPPFHVTFFDLKVLLFVGHVHCFEFHMASWTVNTISVGLPLFLPQYTAIYMKKLMSTFWPKTFGIIINFALSTVKLHYFYSTGQTI